MSATTKTTAATDDSYVEGILIGVFTMAALIPSILFRAWVIVELWAWYVVPGFGIPQIHMSIAYGLSILVAYITPTPGGKSDRPFHVSVVGSFILSVFVLLFGFVGSFFV